MSLHDMKQLTISDVKPRPITFRSRKETSSTRGDYYGIKAKALARDAKLKLAKIRAKVELLQEPWVEADPMIEQAVARAVTALNDLMKQFADSAEYMNESMDE